jgi:hypothetical protein
MRVSAWVPVRPQKLQIAFGLLVFDCLAIIVFLLRNKYGNPAQNAFYLFGDSKASFLETAMAVAAMVGPRQADFS